MESKAQATWTGGLKDGKGSITTGSGVLNNIPFTFATRFEGAKGTNPEELIGAAHSGCFSMALSAELGKASITPNSIETAAVIVLAQQGGGFAVTESRLTTVVTAKGADRAKIEAAAASAKENCPISKLLNAKVSLALTVNT
ncbi:MAG: OsmC family peroxiredoxin [Deltaproteobacteria bacterium]|nr:OsmC family peroxiredoxin [Deltaproteobacteria bacterium]